MLIAAMTVMAAASAVTAIDPRSVRSVAPVCQQTGPHRARDVDGTVFKGPKPMTRNLNQEPNGDAIAAVLYTEGQCSKPVVISRNLGMNPKRK